MKSVKEVEFLFVVMSLLSGHSLLSQRNRQIMNKSYKFLLIDLYLGHTDQHNMIVLAGHVPCYMEEQMKAAMLAIYNDEDAIPKSDFSEYFNNKLLADIDKSNYPRKCEFYYQKIFYHDQLPSFWMS